MGAHELFERITKRIEQNCEKSKVANEYIVPTTLNGVRNRVRLYPHYLERLSERPSKKPKEWQKITEDEIFLIAEQAMSKGKFPIDDLKLISVHGAKGSMICSLLNLLEEEFAYQSVPKRTLVYFGKSVKSTTA